MLKEYKIPDGQDLFKTAVDLYGSVSYAFKLAKDNNIEINDTVGNVTVEYDDSIKNNITSPLVVEAEIIGNLQQIYKPSDNQSIFDIALMTLGGLESIVELIKDSTIEGINSEIRISDRFTYVDTKNNVKLFINSTGVVFSSKSINEEDREHDDSFNRTQFT